MKVPRSTEELLDDIVTWGDKLARHLSDVTEEAFLKDEKTQEPDRAQFVRFFGPPLGALRKLRDAGGGR